MKRIYIRAGMSPFESFPAHKMLLNNSIGQNLGNFLYVYGILRNIVEEDSIVTADYYKTNLSAADIDQINETQDAFIIPLADAFRPGFEKTLYDLTTIVKQLKIPCYLIGVGLRAPYEPDFSNPFPFDDAVKALVSALLEKSAMVGVRGDITAEYLSHLGFREGTDHMAIGCPSMYTLGPSFTLRETNITPQSRVCISTSVTAPDNVLEFLFKKIPAEFQDWHFIPQVTPELRLVYTGSPYKIKCNPAYPHRITDEAYASGGSQFFLNVPTWIEYMSTADLTIGSRLHGNVASILGGTPSIIFPKDARVRELSEYHDFTRFHADELNADTDIWKLIERADFNQPCRKQEANFQRFLGFLDKNEISHIYKDGVPEQIPFLERMKEVKLQPPVKCFSQCSLEEMSTRFERFYPAYEKKLRNTAPPVKAKKSPDAPKKETPAPAAQPQSTVSGAKKLARRILNKLGV